MPGYEDRPRVRDITRGVSAVLTSQGAAVVGICAAALWWTIVVLRDGRRTRSWRADVAQLVAHHLAKVRVAGSNPVIRSKVQWHQPKWWSGRVVRQRPAKPCTRVRFPSPPPVGTPGAISSAGERFPDTEEVTGSIPVSRTTFDAGQNWYLGNLNKFHTTYIQQRSRWHGRRRPLPAFVGIGCGVCWPRHTRHVLAAGIFPLYLLRHDEP